MEEDRAVLRACLLGAYRRVIADKLHAAESALTTSDAAETRFAHQAYVAQQHYGGMPLSVFLTTVGRIQAHPETVLGAIWRGPGPGPQMDRLARVAWLPGRPVSASTEAGG